MRRLHALALAALVSPSYASAEEPVIAFPGQYAPAPAEWKYPAWPRGCARFEGTERTACLEFVALDYARLARFADANGLLKPALNDHGLHPNAAGYAVMAPLAEKAIAEALKRP